MKYLGKSSQHGSGQDGDLTGFRPAGSPGSALAAKDGVLGASDLDPFDRLTGLAAMVLGAPFASITLLGGPASPARTWVDASSAADRRFLAEPELCQQVADSGVPLIIDDLRPELAASGQRTASSRAAAWAGIPVIGPAGVIGMLCVADCLSRHWNVRDVEILAALAHMAAGEAAMQAAIEHRADELAMTGYQPLAQMPTIPGLQIAARCMTGRSGAGREGIFYDAFPAAARRWGLVVAEICDAGSPAGKSTTLARYTLRAQARAAARPSMILAGLNQAVLRRPAAERQQMTAICAIVRPVPAGAIVQVSPAGRVGALVRRASGNVRPAGRPAAVLGLHADPGLRDSRQLLLAGDSLVLVSGTVLEARDQAGTKRFGDDRLAQVVAGLGAASAARATDTVLRAAAAFGGGQLDVACVALVLKVPGNRAGTGTHAAAWPGTHAYPTVNGEVRPQLRTRS